MILIDHRTGSRDILPLLRPWNIRAELTELDSGDFAFVGNGPDGDTLVGVERKRVHDLVNSMQTGRLAGRQLPAMHSTYGYVYLFVEGITRSGSGGELEVRTNSWYQVKRCSQVILWRQVDHFLTTLELRAGVMIRHTAHPPGTASALASLYLYWTSKQWSQHKSHRRTYAPVPEHNGRVAGLSWKPEDIQHKVCRCVAAQLPGIDDKCGKVADYFGSARTMLNADEKEWVKAKVGVGRVGAKRIVEAVG